LDIAADLGLEFAEGSEFLFVAEFCEKRKFNFLTVEIPVEIEQVSLDPCLGPRIIQGGAVADIQNGLGAVPADFGVDSINAVRRQDKSGHLEIGGRET